MREHGHSDYQLIYINKGNGAIYRGRQKTQIQKGDFILYRPGQVQNYTFEKNADYYWIHFSGTSIESLLSDLRLEDLIYTVQDFLRLAKRLIK